VVEAVHLDQIREHGGLIGVRDENALESALARARQRWGYEEDADLARLAADYAFGICSNHPFRDGNKRTAFLAAVIFLGLNGLDFVASQDEVIE
jgi:death-on-curing protein